MVWAKFDDERALNRKLREVGFEARGLDDAAICQAARDESDGFLSEATVEMLGIAHGCKHWRKLVTKLVNVGRWDPDEKAKGWWIHDYLEFNPSRAALQETREKKRVAGRAGGRATAQARAAPPAAPDAQARAAPNVAANGAAPRAGAPRGSRPDPAPGCVQENPQFSRLLGHGPGGGEFATQNGGGDLVGRLEAVCAGTNRDFVHNEAIAVVGWALQGVDANVVDEAIGWLVNADSPPKLPRALAPLIAKHNPTLSQFTPIGTNRP